MGARIMTADDVQGRALGADEVLVYVGDTGADTADGEPQEEPAGILHRKKAKEGGLQVVKIDDAELDRLRSQVSRIATKLEASDGPAPQSGFGVDSITVHVGLSATGHFFFIASAEVEAAVDITWARRKSG
jgi:hypothetical protein